MIKRKLLIIMVACLSITWATCFAQQQTKKQEDASLQKLKTLAATLKKESAPTTQATVPAQQGSQATAPGGAPTQTPDLSTQAFLKVVHQRLPLTTTQIAELYKAFETARKAAATPPGIPPRPTISSIPVNLSPSSTPPIIRLGAGYITTLVFVDATGQPWPIQYYSVGNPAAFYIPANTINIKGGDNVLPIQAKSFYKRSNLIIHLRGLNTPIMLTLVTGQKAIDYRIDLRVPALGPNAILQSETTPIPSNPMLLNVLNGIPPAHNARQLETSGTSNTKAWLLNNKLYLRTRLVVISPGWVTKMTSIDGTNAYLLQPASVILALQSGQDRLIKLFLPNLKD